MCYVSAHFFYLCVVYVCMYGVQRGFTNFKKNILNMKLILYHVSCMAI